MSESAHPPPSAWARHAARLQAPAGHDLTADELRDHVRLSLAPVALSRQRSGSRGLLSYFSHGLALGTLVALSVWRFGSSGPEHFPAPGIAERAPAFTAPAPAAAEPVAAVATAPVAAVEPPIATPAPVPRPQALRERERSKPKQLVAAPEPAAERQPDPEPAAPPFDRSAAARAIASAAAAAASCASGDVSGAARVAVTFAPSGRATSSVVEPGSRFSGSRIGGCIASRMRSARVPAFSGSFVTVHSSVVLP
jgi:hypothetical protein